MWLYYVKVGDVNKVVKKVAELGGQVVNGPMEVPGGDLIAQRLDPQGALFRASLIVELRPLANRPGGGSCDNRRRSTS